jgi:hypothetical protein
MASGGAGHGTAPLAGIGPEGAAVVVGAEV